MKRYDLIMNSRKSELAHEFVLNVKSTEHDPKSLEGEVCILNEKGEECWYQDKLMPVFDENNTQTGQVLVRHDITEKKIYEQLSITDALTQLYNRRHFNHILTQEISRATRNKSILCFIVLDVDYFKKYNDSYGHKAGDDALISVAKALKNSLHRGGDFAFRLGGEEFGAIFSADDENHAFEFADAIRADIEALNIQHSNSEVSDHITVSIGLLVVDFATTGIDEDNFFTLADNALYIAKDNGRNRVVIHQNETLELF